MNAPSGVFGKRISPQAYEALAEALAAIHWNKAPFERHLRLALREHPDFVARIDFTQTKRTVAGTVVQLLAHDARYQQIMTDLADMRTFPNLATQTDANTLLARAQAAVSHLRVLTSTYRRDLDDQERLATQRKASTHSASTSASMDLQTGSSPFRTRTGCPFITMDGEDLFLILDGRADLQEAIHRKRRHLNDTGSCHFPVRTLLL